VARYYGPLLRAAVRWRYVTLAGALALLAGVAGYVFSGRIGMILMPRVEADYAFATARLPVGCPLSQAMAVRDRLERTANAVAAENGGDRLLEGVFAVINENVIEMRAYLTPPEVRPISTSKLTDLWRARVGEIPGTESVRFQADRGGPGGGASLTVELSHRDIAVLDQASARLAEILDGFSNIKDIDDGYTPGKEQLNFTLKPEGYSLGLTVRDVARQVRNAFYGAEALRLQRGRSEIKVRVRFPESERMSEADIEDMMIHTAAGRDVPLRDVANVVRGRAYTDISRREGRRTVTVTADVVPIGDTNRVIATLDSDVLPQLARDFPGLGYGYEGRQADMAESMQRLFSLLILVLLTIFVMLALPFRSYIQPLIVMTAIPFGLVGAVFGHLIMGYDLSVISLMGILALSGVVVNDAIVLIDHANERRREGLSPFLAVTQAGIRRFRPIMLTTLTTFGGLAPMIFETSRQARFMIPMALSLGYGILFATSITLVLVPSLYLIAEDVKGLAPSTRRARRVARPAVSAASSVLLALTLVLTSTARAGERVDEHATPEGPAVERINQAIRAASPRGLRVVIPRQNKARSGARDVWLLDSAILVQDNATLELDGCHMKLSDRCRDNMIRSANCGLGITDTRTMRHVSIIGRGNVLLEGADHPRATGDSAKTLVKHTFGTDRGEPITYESGRKFVRNVQVTNVLRAGAPDNR
jgi:multidrug efflux pump subunit AcrB